MPDAGDTIGYGATRNRVDPAWRPKPIVGIGLIAMALAVVIAIVGFGIGRPGGEGDETVGRDGAVIGAAPMTGAGTPGSTAPNAPNAPTSVSSGSMGVATDSLVNDPHEDGVAVVCLDPGHGGSDDGFVQPGDRGVDTLVEAELNLTHARDLAARLEGWGIVVVMTRRDERGPNDANDDINGDGETYDSVVASGESGYEAGRAAEYDDLQARINICNRANADVLVSMHINGYDARPTARGFETWYTGCREFGDQSELLASLTYQALDDHFDEMGFVTEARGVKDDCTVDVDASDGQLAQSMLMTGPAITGQIVPSQMPGVLVESLFVSNPEDAAFLASEAGTTAIVDAYEDAILGFFAETP